MNTSLRAHIANRVRQDPRIGIYLAIAVTALPVLLPLLVLRTMEGRYANAALNLTMIALALGAAWFALRSRKLDRLGGVFSVLMTMGGILSILISPAGLYWAYPVILLVALLAPPKMTLLLVLALLASLVAQRELLLATGQPLAALAALIANAVFASLFALRSQRRQQTLEHIASTDALTGAWNRRSLDAELRIAITTFRRDRRPVALVLIDIDHFKPFNDRHGHAAGDQVLVALADAVRQSVRATDRLFRYGGEEFVLLMPGADLLGVELSMSQLRRELREALRIHGEQVTVSMGAAVLGDGEDAARWLARADAALYCAKNTGRDRLEVDPG